MTAPEEHRRLRELLGAYALGGLPDDAAAGVRAHLDGCPACRAELAEIAPLADELRTVDLGALALHATPPADLGERIRRRVAAERELAEARGRRDRRAATARRARRSVVAVAAAMALAATALGAGTLLGRSTAPSPTVGASPSAAPIPVEPLPLQAGAGLAVDPATLVAHTWGVEARFAGSGFLAGEVYRAAFRADDGRLVPAGEFRGTGDARITCNLQSSLLRDDTAAFVVVDASGAPVLTAQL